MINQSRPSTAREADDRLLLLSGHDLESLLTPQTVIDALHEAYRELASNRADQGKSIGFVLEGGTAHIKTGLLPGSRAVLAAKVNINLPGNWKVRGLPTIQGAVLLADTISGRPLAVMESMTLTAIRTAATAMLGARYGARRDSKIAAIIGCGVQAHYQVKALRAGFAIEEIRVFDLDTTRAQTFATAIADSGVRATPAASIAVAVAGADICITCTTSKQAVLTNDLALAGCFVAAMGADNPEKCEIAPRLMARARILVDDLESCAAGGDLAHALRAGSVSLEAVRADLADLASGLKNGRNSSDELVIFDSTGSGIQDVAAAWVAYRTACETGQGMRFNLSGRDGRN